MGTSPIRSPLRHLKVAEIDAAAKQETRNREVHLPPISVYRWWARRTETVNGAIIDAFSTDHIHRLLVADPFSGGGVIPIAAIVRGHRVYAQDLNPWAAHGLRAMLSLPPQGRLREAVEKVKAQLTQTLARAYATAMSDGRPATVAHTFRVATAPCPSCSTTLRLFPHALVSLLRRKERGDPDAFLACRQGHLFRGRSDSEPACPKCGTTTDPQVTYTTGRTVSCHQCGTTTTLEELARGGAWNWQTTLVERVTATARELAIPTANELEQAEVGWTPVRNLGQIPYGQETSVLLRHHFRNWHDLYPARQRVVLEELLDAIECAAEDGPVAEALRMAALGTVEMAGLASRWDRWYLKSYEAMASHRFNFTTFAAEPNVWGTSTAGRGTFTRRIALFEKAASWFEDRAGIANVEGPLLSTVSRRAVARSTDVRVVHGSSERMVLQAGTVDLVLTDPPYHDDVQYGELSLPLRAWAGLDITDLVGEAVGGNGTAFAEYEGLLSRIFAEARRCLRTDGHLIFSYANREPEAWAAILSSLKRAGLRSCGYAIVHSENETDHSKRNVRACTLDLILDVLPQGEQPVDRWRPRSAPTTPEGKFLRIVGDALLDLAECGEEWRRRFVDRLRATEFLSR